MPRPSRAAYRQRLGFCVDCLNRPAEGRVRCARHLAANAGRQRKHRGSIRQRRGWRLARVPGWLTDDLILAAIENGVLARPRRPPIPSRLRWLFPDLFDVEHPPDPF